MSLLQPLFLVGFPIAFGILLYAYLRKGRGEKLRVATTLFLKHLSSTPRARQKIVPPFRFFFELLLLSLLFLLASGLSFKGLNQKVLILIDNSLSMAARDFSDAKARRALDRALDEAKAQLALMSPFTQVKVFTTSPDLTAISNEFESKSSASKRLNEIPVSFSEDNIEAHLSRLLISAEANKILVFSDKRAPLSVDNSEVELHTVAPTLENIALSNISFNRDALEQNELTITTLVQSFAKNGTNLSVKLDALRASDLTFANIQEKQINLAPNETKLVTFTDVPSQAKAFQVNLVLSGREKNNRFDSILEDNTAYLSSVNQSEKVLLVSPLSASELGLTKMRTVQFETKSIREYEAINPEYWQSADAPAAILFHRVLPAKFPSKNSVFVLPPPGNALITTKAKQQGQFQLTRWFGSHPLLSYLNLTSLELPELTPLEKPFWGQELINTQIGAAAIAGEREGRRIIALGFEILPFEGRSAPFFSIFLLNIFKWLTDISSSVGYFQANAQFNVPKGIKSFRYMNSSEAPLVAPGSEVPAALKLPKPGLVLANEATRPQVIAVNYFNGEESNTLHQKEFNIASVQLEKPSDNENSALLAWGTSIVALLLLIDVIYLATTILKGKKHVAAG